MTVRRSTAWRLGGLAAVIALAAGGCSAAAGSAGAGGAGGTHRLTMTQAEAVYESYVSANDSAAASGNAAQGLTKVAYAQWAVVKSQFLALTGAGTPVPRYRYGQPAFDVPSQTGSREWFVVTVPRQEVLGSQLSATTSTLMLFERPKPSLPWTVIGTATLDQGLPGLARDRDGYAVAVADNDASVVLRPNALGATQAAVVDEGPANPAAAVVGDGPLTTGLYGSQAAQASSDQAQGLQYQWLLEGSDYPQFELKTADGGALVIYAMALNVTTQHANTSSGKPASGSPISVPTAFVPLLGATNEVGYHEVITDWTFEYVAVDPPATAHGAKVDVIGSGGGPTYGHAY
ncbi:MAG: hypothetical protein ACRDOB_04430 [Streptosporangiaceae bacterium]